MVSVGEASIIRSFDKVWGYVLGYFLLDEAIDLISAIGASLILIAVVLLAVSKMKFQCKTAGHPDGIEISESVSKLEDTNEQS